MDAPQSFGEWLRHRRRALDLTQQALAQRVGCARVTIRKLEADEMHPSKQLAELLAEQLGIPPEERATFVRLGRSGLPVDLTTATTPRHNLPINLSSFIGREREVTAIQHMLQSARLVTLTGSGGIGKTRLALQAATELLEAYPDGVWWVELAAVRDPALVAQAVAKVRGVREIPHRPWQETLVDSIRGQELLLVLDNCEHLISACAQLTDRLLSMCPNLHVLATSREALDIPGETIWTVPSLSLPDLREPSAAQALSKFESIRLFTDRAKTVQPQFELTDQNAEAVAKICRRMSGIPLALELAAARVKMMSVDELAQRLADRFDLLTGGSRTTLPRHQTLRATIDWSFDLLSALERTFFCRLSVFVGGFTMEAAEAIATGSDISKTQIVDLVGRLINKSLVTMDERSGDTESETRYGMLDTVREYARERMAVAPNDEADRVQRRFIEYYLRMAEDAEPHLRTAQRPNWSAQLEIEHDNLRAALELIKISYDVASVVRLVRALTWFWFLNGYLSEGRAHLEYALSQATSAKRTLARAAILFGAGAYAETQADYTTASDRLTESITIYRELGDELQCAYPLLFQALVMTYQDHPDLPQAFELFHSSIRLFQEVQDTWGEAYALTSLGDALLALDDIAAARTVLETGLKLWRAVNDSWGIGTHLFIMGGVDWYDGNYATARTRCQEAVDRLRAYADKWGLARALNRLGYALLYLGELQPATGCFTESLTLFREIGNRRGVIYCLAGLGGAVARLGWPDRAARIFGAIQIMSGATSMLQFGMDRARYQRTLALARAEAHDEVAWNAAYAEGQVMALEQVIKLAAEATDRRLLR